MRLSRLDTSDPEAVRALLAQLAAGSLVVAERLICPPWMPRRVVASLYNATGIVRGICAAYGHRLELVAPRVWQTTLFGPSAPKHHTNQRPEADRKKSFVLWARKTWPEGDFPFSHGTADAAWLALYGALGKIRA